MQKLRQTNNGDYFAPRRGSPPIIPEGYSRDTKDPYLFHLILEPCLYLGKKRTILKCCGIKIFSYCRRDSMVTTPRLCKLCQERNEHVTSSQTI